MQYPPFLCLLFNTVPEAMNKRIDGSVGAHISANVIAEIGITTVYNSRATTTNTNTNS